MGGEKNLGPKKMGALCGRTGCTPMRPGLPILLLWFARHSETEHIIDQLEMQ